jgi:hypothetical protein
MTRLALVATAAATVSAAFAPSALADGLLGSTQEVLGSTTTGATALVTSTADTAATSTGTTAVVDPVVQTTTTTEPVVASVTDTTKVVTTTVDAATEPVVETGGAATLPVAEAMSPLVTATSEPAADPAPDSTQTAAPTEASSPAPGTAATSAATPATSTPPTSTTKPIAPHPAGTAPVQAQRAARMHARRSSAEPPSTLGRSLGVWPAESPATAPRGPSTTQPGGAHRLPALPPSPDRDPLGLGGVTSSAAGIGTALLVLAGLAALFVLAAQRPGRRLRPGSAPWRLPVLNLRLERPG